ncbi:MAG: peptidoglycan-binding protein [Oscillatoriaceae cyanobacterium Prado104]|nr:peptidoglycan-binding protein [Oscillatoriaceae cyanobacterium Prado104]
MVRLQKCLLVELGLSAGLADGKFGPKTEASLKQFQTNKGLLAGGMQILKKIRTEVLTTSQYEPCRSDR